MAKQMHIRRDDSVVVISGKEKGKTGRVIRTEPGRGRVFVEGLNIVKRHTRPRSVKDTQKAQSSGIIEKEGPIDVSNVMLLDPTDNKPTRVGMRAIDGGAGSGTRSAPARRSSRPEMEAATATDTQKPAPPPRLRELYESEIVGRLTEKFGYSSRMEVPRLEKITLNMGVGEAKTATPILEAATEQLATIAGQHPNVRTARKSIANFKLREGMPVGVAVTLRGARMWEFLDRLVSIAIPRIRDFRGLNARAFDGRGNYSLGIREQLIFPEIDYDSIDQVRGLDVAITTSAQTDEEAFELLLALGMPFARGRPGTSRARGRRGGRAPSRGGAPARRGGAGRARAAQGGEPRGLREARAPRRGRGGRGRRPRARRERLQAKRSARMTVMAKTSQTSRPTAHAQIQDPRVQPLPPLRPPPRLLPQVRALPALPA